MAAPPSIAVGPVGWLRTNLFSSIGNSILSVGCIAIIALVVPPLFRWAIWNAVWPGASDANAQCRAAQGIGACWAFVAEKWRLIIFGLYPFDQQWRPALVIVIMIALVIISMIRQFWRPWLGIAWLIGIIAMAVLMFGGVLGLPFVETDKWGGLPLTLILAATGILFSFPLAVALALGRRSALPVIRTLCTGFIEFVRGVPLISVLFMARFMIPLFLPQGMNFNDLLKAQVGIILFTAAYVAEVMRGGLQAVPKGQGEAADTLGLTYLQKMGFIVLPQALRLVIPPMVNSFISMLKDTSLVIIVGLFDLMGAARLAANDPQWRPFYIESLVFIALIYFVMCFSLARYSRYLERLARKGDQR